MQCQMAFKVSALWEILKKKKKKKFCWNKPLQCLMGGIFPSTCFQNKIDVGPPVSPRNLSPGPRHLDAFWCASRRLGCKSPEPQCLREQSGEARNTVACDSWVLALWLPARWAAGQAGKLAGNQAAGFLLSI